MKALDDVSAFVKQLESTFPENVTVISASIRMDVFSNRFNCELTFYTKGWDFEKQEVPTTDRLEAVAHHKQYADLTYRYGKNFE